MTASKLTTRAMTIPAGLLCAAGASLGVTLLGAGGAAWAVLRGIIPEKGTGYCAMVILLLASMAGSSVAAGTIQRLRTQMCLAAAGTYWLCLLTITALFFGGQYQGVGVTALMVLCGSGLVILLAPGSKNRAGCRRRKKRR